MRLQSPLPRSFSTLLVLIAACFSSGCRAHRTLEIRTNPPGAEIVLDQESLGPSPAQIEFYHYGARRISAALPRYHIYSERIEIQPPWYARFPLDLFSEVFFPVGWSDHHVITIDLSKASDQIQAPDIRSVLERAEVLRRAGPAGVKELPEVRVVSVGSDVISDIEESDSDAPQP